MAELYNLATARKNAAAVYFSRTELNQLLSIYSSRVIRGEWRDYAIDHKAGMAVFSIFKSSHEAPLYSIIKQSQNSKQGRYALFKGRHRLASGAALGDVLKSLQQQLRLVVG